MSMNVIPDHVPPELVRDYNYFDMEGDQDIYEHFHKLHGGPDIFFTPHHGGHWVVTRYDDLEHIFKTASDFSSRHCLIPNNPVPIALIEMDGVMHTDFRGLLQPFFSPKHIGALEQIATDLTISLIEGFHAKGECEFTRDFAMHMPIIIVMNLCQLPPEDTPYLTQITEDITRSGNPEVEAAAFGRVFQYYAEKIIPLRKAKPGNDMISAIVHGKVDGGRGLTDSEMLTLCALITVGGLDTVASMLGFMAMFLARNPAHRRWLIENPDQVNAAREEMVRRNHISALARVVVNDMDFKGVRFKAGDMVLLANTLAGIDEGHYPDAFKVDFQRENKKHLAFGAGPHQCIGSFLARTELKVFLTEWLKRIPDFEIKAGESPVVLPGKANRISYLPLTWKVA